MYVLWIAGEWWRVLLIGCPDNGAQRLVGSVFVKEKMAIPLSPPYWNNDCPQSLIASLNPHVLVDLPLSLCTSVRHPIVPFPYKFGSSPAPIPHRPLPFPLWQPRLLSSPCPTPLLPLSATRTSTSLIPWRRLSTNSTNLKGPCLRALLALIGTHCRTS